MATTSMPTMVRYTASGQRSMILASMQLIRLISGEIVHQPNEISNWIARPVRQIPMECVKCYPRTRMNTFQNSDACPERFFQGGRNGYFERCGRFQLRANLQGQSTYNAIPSHPKQIIHSKVFDVQKIQ